MSNDGITACSPRSVLVKSCEGQADVTRSLLSCASMLGLFLFLEWKGQQKTPVKTGVFDSKLVAGAGFEPAAFRL